MGGRRWSAAAALGICAALAGGEAEACLGPRPIDMTEILHADLVVVGRVAEFTAERKGPAQAPGGGAYMKTIGDAIMTIEVEEILRGEAPERLTAVWPSSSGPGAGPPSSAPSGLHLIGLSAAGALQDRGFQPTFDRPDLPTVLQPPCSMGLVFAEGSEDAAEARRLLLEAAAKEKEAPASP